MYFILKCKNYSSLCHLLFKQRKQISRNAFSLPVIYRKSVLNKSKYELIYDFPLIKYPVAFARSRYSVTIGVVIITPFLIFFCSKASAVTCLMSAGLHYIISLASSKLSENIVGKIYVNKEDDLQDIIISSIDKFGRRIDRSHKLDELINCDYYSKFSRPFGFVRLVKENSTIHYKINVRHCIIHNPEVCGYVLGRFWPVQERKHTEKKL